MERDVAGRVIAERVGEREVRSWYDLIGERAEMTTSLGARVAIARDALGDPTLFLAALRASNTIRAACSSSQRTSQKSRWSETSRAALSRSGWASARFGVCKDESFECT